MGSLFSRSGADSDAVRRINVGSSGDAFPPNVVKNTKYTLLSFLPLFLAQEFSRHMTKYFLMIACLQLWSTVTPVVRGTEWGLYTADRRPRKREMRPRIH